MACAFAVPFDQSAVLSFGAFMFFFGLFLPLPLRLHPLGLGKGGRSRSSSPTGKPIGSPTSSPRRTSPSPTPAWPPASSIHSDKERSTSCSEPGSSSAGRSQGRTDPPGGFNRILTVLQLAKTDVAGLSLWEFRTQSNNKREECYEIIDGSARGGFGGGVHGRLRDDQAKGAQGQGSQGVARPTPGRRPQWREPGRSKAAPRTPGSWRPRRPPASTPPSPCAIS